MRYSPRRERRREAAVSNNITYNFLDNKVFTFGTVVFVKNGPEFWEFSQVRREK